MSHIIVRFLGPVLLSMVVLSAGCAGTPPWSLGTHVASIPYGKQMVFSSPDMGLIYDLAIHTRPDGHPIILLAASNGVYHLTRAGIRTRLQPYRDIGEGGWRARFVKDKNDALGVRVIVIDSDNERTYLLNSQGETIWTVPTEYYSTTPRVLDVDGDGIDEIAIGVPDRITLYDVGGTVLREWPTKSGYDFVALNQSGAVGPVIAVQDELNRITYWPAKSPDRSEAWMLELDQKLYQTAKLEKLNGIPDSLIIPGDERLSIYGIDGNLSRTLEAPGIESYVRFRAVEHRIHGHRITVVLGTTAWASANVLYVYNSEDHLVFHEVSPEGAMSLLLKVAPESEPATVNVYVGVRNALWRYTFPTLIEN